MELVRAELVPSLIGAEDEDVDWLECISAIETDQGLLYFCDASYGQSNPHLSVMSEFRAQFPEGTYLYSITAYNPYNKVSNRLVNEIANNHLLVDLKRLLPNCKIYQNFSYFPSRPYHFERGYTIQVPADYPIYNHEMIIYSLSIKYQQAAFFKGVVLKNGLTIPYVILVQGEYTEVKEELVTIRHSTMHPAFLHKANHAVFKDITEVLDLLYQTKDHISLCAELYQIFQDNYQPINHNKHRFPIIAIEGLYSKDTADKVSRSLDADYCGNTPKCLDLEQQKFKQSTVLQAAFKTIADYLQAAYIAKKSEEKPVIVHKYWSNTAASLIASEISKGQANIPPKHHEIYQWPANLLKPDAVVLLKGKPHGKIRNAEKTKLKTSVLKRMADDSWIPLTCGGVKKLDYMTSLIVDKLAQVGITRMVSVDPLCPASDLAPQQTVLLTNEELQHVLPPEKVEENNNEKPFWW